MSVEGRLNAAEGDIACAYVVLATLTIGMYAAMLEDDVEKMREQLKHTAIHAQAMFPEQFFNILMEKISKNPFGEAVQAERDDYKRVMGL
jgi:hypothetical protein